MNLSLVRIDDRFIHGQILESWVPYLHANGVVIANDNMASDEFQKTIMAMALPDRMTFKVSRVDYAATLKDDPALDGKSVLLIVSSFKDAYSLYNNGLVFKRLNIGNIKAKNGDYQLSFSVWVDHKDIEIIEYLIAKGVYVGVQSVPRERDIDVSTILDVITL